MNIFVKSYLSRYFQNVKCIKYVDNKSRRIFKYSTRTFCNYFNIAYLLEVGIDMLKVNIKKKNLSTINYRLVIYFKGTL